MSEFTNKLAVDLNAEAGCAEDEAARLLTVVNILRGAAAELDQTSSPANKSKRKARKKGKKRGRPTNAEVAAREAANRETVTI
jgi:hypothetical protein